MDRIIISGGTGFLGSLLSSHFSKKGWEVVVLSRKEEDQHDSVVRHVKWDAASLGPWRRELEGASVLLNLCGRSVDCRYTPENKALIYSSRLDSTAVLAAAMASCENPPRVWMNSSSATIYRHAMDRPQTERDGELGEGFSVDVCKQWEAEFYQMDLPCRRVALRTSIVCDRSGGALVPLMRLARFGLGGKQGSGNQMFSWISGRDFCRAVEFIIDHDELEGAVNLACPYPINNAVLMRRLRKAVGMPIGFPMPRWLLDMGARLIGTETELILKSRWVLPQKLLDAGFEFKDADPDPLAIGVTSLPR